MREMDHHDHIACAHCNAINRISETRFGDNPKCGRCKQPLFTGKPVTLTDASFSAHIERSSIPVVVDFWAPWCAPCKMMAPHFERAAGNLESNVRLAKLNTDENPDVAGRFNIRSIPTMILFRNGKEIARQSGAMDSNALTNWIQGQV